MRIFALPLLLAVTATPAAGPAQFESRKVASVHHALGTFDVKMKPEPLSEVAGSTGIMRMAMDKIFHGQLEGASQGEFLAYGEPPTGGYVAIERVTGTLDGKSGSFAFMHSATIADNQPALSVTVVPGSGTGELGGISGTFTIIIEGGKHSYDFVYSL
jgi:hypothetical protein